MIKKEPKTVFKGWRYKGVLYPPDSPPQEIVDRIRAVLREVYKERTQL